ncbi:grx [Linum perenne]
MELINGEAQTEQQLVADKSDCRIKCLEFDTDYSAEAEVIGGDTEEDNDFNFNSDGGENRGVRSNDAKVVEAMEQLPETEPPDAEETVEIHDNRDSDDISDGYSIKVISPHSKLPKPEPPPGLSPENRVAGIRSDLLGRSKSLTETLAAVDMPSIGNFFKERSNSLSAIAKRLSRIGEEKKNKAESESEFESDFDVSEYNISGIRVVVRMKSDEEIKGRISFFSRSNCRDCSAVRSFLKQRAIRYVEINVDVYPEREKELIERTGSSRVPQIFFNEKLFGGLVELNSMRNSGELEAKLKEMLGKVCPGEAPAEPVYGFDDDPEEEAAEEELVGIVKVLRKKLPIEDRLVKMKIVRNCFAGAQMVEVLIQHLDCGRKKAVEIGKQLAQRHFIHHVLGENEFEDGNHLYRFLEHEPFIPKCYNFRGTTSDRNPNPAVVVGRRIYKIMSAILESYASDDRRHVDYGSISKTEEFRRYVNVVEDLQRVDLVGLGVNEKTAFFLNLYNAMVIHAVIRVGSPEGVTDRRSFYSDFQYIVGGLSYSLNAIKNGILRNNQRSPYSFIKPFGSGDKRLEIVVDKVNPLIHFGLCNGTRSSPMVRFFTPQGVESELRSATREFFQTAGGIEVDLETRTVHLSRIMKWFGSDFGPEKEILKWVMSYLDGNKAGLVTHLLSDGAAVHIVYQNYEWSLNS